jgi:hypothetical protein
VTVIGEYTFRDCEALTSIVVPDYVTFIGDSAFRGCIKLSNITLPDTIISINNGAFNDTAYYQNSSNWNNGVLYIGTHLIDVKPSVSDTYTIKDGTLTIADDAFSHCSNLSDLTIPESVTLIGYEAFEGCVNLKHIEIPASVQYISTYAFDGSNLSSVTVEEGNLNYKSVDGILYDRELTQIIYVPPQIEGEVTIPEGITEIEAFAFYNCSGLTKITLPSTVTTIGSAAFFNCSGLTEMNLHEGLTTINDNAFANCGLTQLTIPSSVTWIGSYAFSNNKSLTSVAFAAGETWKVTSYMDPDLDRSVAVDNATNNAKLLTATYVDCIWSLSVG